MARLNVATVLGVAILAGGVHPGALEAREAVRFSGRALLEQSSDSLLKGLTRLGVVVEGLSTQAAACGLSQDAIESAVSKRLADAGLKVALNSDEDTYVYVNVQTATIPSGLCVSRYDAFLYTHTTAKLSYQQVPVLVEVSLLHKGGLAGGAPTAHGDAVRKGVLEYVDQFATRIHDANR